MQTTTLQRNRALHTALLVLLLGAVGMGKTHSQDFNVGDLNYSVNDDGTTVTVTGHVDGTSATGALIIPPSITFEGQAYTVTIIGVDAFSGCNGFTGNLSIPNTVSLIGSGAFSGCDGFVGNLIFPESVISIGRYSFSRCSGINAISISNSVQKLFRESFMYTGWYNNQPNGILYLDGWCLGYKGDKPIGTLIIQEGTRKIAGFAFNGCGGLTGNLDIPNSVISICTEAFSGSGFTGRLNIPNSVTSIGGWAFKWCRFSEINYNASNCAESIDGNYGQFYECSGMLIIGENVERIPSHLFEWSALSGNLTIPNSVTEIGEEAFYFCSGFIGDLIIPSSISYISRSAFSGCSGLNGSLVIPSTVTEIGDGAFELCSGFTGNLTIPNSVITIGDWAFAYCSGFTGNLIIPYSVTKIGNAAFNGCSGFNGNLIIENPQIEIGEGVFSYCSRLTGTLVIPNSWTSISRGLFWGCSGFTGDLTIPNSVTEIGESAFWGCSGFTGDLTIPDSVTEIGESAFRGCSGFTGSLIISNSVTAIGEATFQGCSNFTRLVLGNSLQYIGMGAFMDCYGFSADLIIPNHVTQIDVAAFLGCNGFDDCIVLGDNPPQLEAIDEYYPFDESITHLIVPCGSKAAYEASDWAGYFTIIDENCGAHSINIDNISSNGGTVSVSTNSANLGDEVQITVTPNTGMSLSLLTVCNASDPSQIVPVYPIGKASSTYGFTMPYYDVTIKAVFTHGNAVGEGNSIAASVYPNPTSGQVKIEAEGLKQITISDMLGQVIYDGEAEGDAFEYDFNKHGAGVYLVRIETERGSVVKKVTVTK